MNQELYEKLLLGDCHSRFIRGGYIFYPKERRSVQRYGYYLKGKHYVHLAGFSAGRQVLLDQVHVNIRNPTAFRKNIRSRSFIALCSERRLPTELVRRIVNHL
jgi:hypothetical protein